MNRGPVFILRTLSVSATTDQIIMKVGGGLTLNLVPELMAIIFSC